MVTVPNTGKEHTETKQAWIPILLGGSLALLVIVLWQLLLAQERAHLQGTVASQAQHVSGLLKENLEGRILALKRIAKRWEMRGGTPQREWEADVSNYITDNPDYQAIEWVDPSLHVRWIWPLKGNEKAQDLNLAFESNRRIALENARDRQIVTVTQPIDLVQGGKGFLVFVPVFVKEEFNGFILAVIRIEEWLDSVLANVQAQHYAVQLFKNGEEVYVRKKTSTQYEANAAQEAELRVYGLTLRIRSCPSPALVAQSTTWLPEISLAVGLILALLMAFAAHLSQIATSRAKSIKKVNQDLIKEKSERRPIEEALQLTQFSVDRAGDSVFWIGPDSHFLYVNDAACQGLGYTRDELLKMTVDDIDPDWTPEVWPDFWQKLKEQKVLHFESRHQRKDGSVVPIEITTNFMEFEGKEYDFAAVRNISERKRTEEALQESEAWFKTISEAIPHQVWTANPDGTLDYVNAKVLEYFERSADQMIGWNWTEVLHPDDLPVCLDRWAQAREQCIPYEMEFRAQRASDKSYRWFLARALPFKNQEGQIIKWFGTSTDITEHKHAAEVLRQAHDELEERVTKRTAELVSSNATLEVEIAERKHIEKLLRESEQRLNSILEHSPSLIFIKDRKGRYLHTNSQFEKVFHFDKHQILGRTDEDLFTPTQAAKFRQNDELVIQRQAPLAFEEVAVHDDGPHTSVVSKFPLFDDKGKIHGICGITLDITERTRAEAALKESEERWQLALEGSRDGVWDWNILTDEVFYSKRWKAIFGFKEHEVPHHVSSFSERVHSDDIGGVWKEVDRYFKGEIPTYQREFRMLHRDGSIVWVLNRGVAVFNELHKPIRMLGTIVDITEQKRLEEDIRKLNASLEERVQQRTAELEAKNAELERFTYTVSHDLKSPLITIQGFLKLVMQNIHTGQTARLEEDLQRINKATKKLHLIINQLLELSRVGRIIGKPEPVSLDEVTHEAMERVDGAIGSRGVRVDIASDLPMVLADRSRLIEAVQNLIDNAVKFMGDQTEPQIEIGHRKNGEHAILYVRDNGIGIESRHQEKVFTLFEQLDANQQGTGIGLTLVKRIIELQGGQIWVESAGQGQGSTFCVTLPTTEIGSAV